MSEDSFGVEVRQRRVLLRMSQGDLARLAGVSRNTIGNVEQGRGQTESLTIQALRDALAVAESENPSTRAERIDPVRESIARIFDALVDALPEDLAPADSMSPESIAIRATRRAYINAARIARGEDL